MALFPSLTFHIELDPGMCALTKAAVMCPLGPAQSGMALLKAHLYGTSLQRKICRLHSVPQRGSETCSLML